MGTMPFLTLPRLEPGRLKDDPLEYLVMGEFEQVTPARILSHHDGPAAHVALELGTNQRQADVPATIHQTHQHRERCLRFDGNHLVASLGLDLLDEVDDGPDRVVAVTDVVGDDPQVATENVLQIAFAVGVDLVAGDTDNG